MGKKNLPALFDRYYGELVDLFCDDPLADNVGAEVYPLLFVTYDLAVLQAGENRASALSAFLLWTKIPEENPKQYNSRVDLYGKAIRGMIPHGFCAPDGISTLHSHALARCGILFCDLLVYPACANDYENSPIPIFQSTLMSDFAPKVHRVINILARYFREILKFCQTVGLSPAEPALSSAVASAKEACPAPSAARSYGAPSKRSAVLSLAVFAGTALIGCCGAVILALCLAMKNLLYHYILSLYAYYPVIAIVCYLGKKHFRDPLRAGCAICSPMFVSLALSLAVNHVSITFLLSGIGIVCSLLILEGYLLGNPFSKTWYLRTNPKTSSRSTPMAWISTHPKAVLGLTLIFCLLLVTVGAAMLLWLPPGSA